MAEPIIKYDSKGNLIYKKDSYGREYWYNENGNEIHFKNPYGYERWYEYDKYNNNFFYLNRNNQIYWEKNPIFEEYHNTILFY
jgi:hypothetical protein